MLSAISDLKFRSLINQSLISLTQLTFSRYAPKCKSSESCQLFINSKIGIPLSIQRPKLFKRLSTISMSYKLLFLIIRKSLIKNPFLVCMQCFLVKTNDTNLLFGSIWLIIAFAQLYMAAVKITISYFLLIFSRNCFK